jgi:hypothetical protein
VPLLIAGGIILALLFVMWIAFAKEPGPGPADVAIAYETAWDHLDFDLLFDLSGEELRDGLRREAFVRTKRDAFARARASTPATSASTGRLGARVEVEDVVSTQQTAVVATRVTTDEGPVRNRVLLEKRSTGWTVVGYSIRAT